MPPNSVPAKPFAQLEKARRNNALTIYGCVWDLVTVEGTIKRRSIKKT